MAFKIQIMQPATFTTVKMWWEDGVEAMDSEFRAWSPDKCLKDLTTSFPKGICYRLMAPSKGWLCVSGYDLEPSSLPVSAVAPLKAT